jgi:sugar phosphate permease
MDNGKAKRLVSRPRIYYGWYIVAVSWIISFFVSATAIGIFFKPILDEFGWDRPTLSMVSAVTMVIFGLISPFMGRLIDRFGTRTMMIISILGQTLSSVVYGMSSSLGTIYSASFLYQLKPTHSSQVLINRWFMKQRGKALGILSTSIPLGTLALSPVSQLMITGLGWRPTMFFWAGVSAIVLLPLTLLIRNKPSDKELVTNGVLPAGEIYISAPLQVKTNIISGQAKPDTGYSMAEVIKNSSFWLLALTQLICGVGCGLMATHTVIFATDLGYSAMIGATFLSVQGGVSLLGVLITGPMSDHWPRNKVLSMTHLIRSSSFVLVVVTIIFAHDSLLLLYLAMALFGFGWFTTAPLAAGLVADLFGNLRMGTILGITLAGHMIGTAIGAYAGGITYQLTGSYMRIFFISAAIEFIAAVLAFSIKTRKFRY